MPAEISPAADRPIVASRRRRRIALALEYPLMQQGGTEVLARELFVRLSKNFELFLVSGDARATDLPSNFQTLICGHRSWNPQIADSNRARQLAAELFRENIEFAHFHFGGTYEWRSNRFGNCP